MGAGTLPSRTRVMSDTGSLLLLLLLLLLLFL